MIDTTEKESTALSGAANECGVESTSSSTHCDLLNLPPKWIKLPCGGMLNVEHVVEVFPELVEMDNGTTMLSIEVVDVTGKTRELGPMVVWSHSNYADGCENDFCEGIIKMFDLMKPGQKLRTYNFSNQCDYIDGYPRSWAAVIEG